MTAPPPSTLTAVADSDHVTGSDEAGLTLVEYGDFGCPFCLVASRPVKSLLDRFDGLRLVWRHFPDAELHPGADLAAELSELAGAHGKFWEAHSLLLAGREGFSHEDLLEVARRLELDEEEVDAALRERSFRERVLADVAGGRRAGVHGTPTFFVDGERLDGPWRQLAQIVPAKLEKRSHSGETQQLATDVRLSAWLRRQTGDDSGTGSAVAGTSSGISSCPGGAAGRRSSAPSAPITAKAAATRNAAL